MTFDLKGLKDAVARHGRVARVLVADLGGSSPREVGAAMLIWAEGDGFGQCGTIGGGALEYHAALAARAQLAGDNSVSLTHHALGPDLGQCCGGKVSLLTETYDMETISGLSSGSIVRKVAGDNRDMPLRVTRVIAEARNQGIRPNPGLVDGWMIEPVLQPTRPVWVWGAGHVGRAIMDVLAPLPDLDLTWIDTARDRFPQNIAPHITVIAQENPCDLVRHAPGDATHYVLTYSHSLDLELCHALLSHEFRFAGLIGSATKWARFRKRLVALGHAPHAIARITCPIGDPSLGKHPAQIAVGVAHELMTHHAAPALRKDKRA